MNTQEKNKQILEKTEEILREHGSPLHNSIILEILVGRYGIKITRQKLYSVIFSEDTGRIFPVSPGVLNYGIESWMRYRKTNFVSLVARKYSDWKKMVETFQWLFETTIREFTPNCDSWGTIELVKNTERINILVTKTNYSSDAEKLDEEYERSLK